MIQFMLFDLDGVLRHFSPAASAAIAGAHGLAPGALFRAAFQPALVAPVIRGQRTRQDWVQQLGEIVGSPEAAAAFLGQTGQVDPAVRALVGRLRVPVGLLSNATDTLAAELSAVGLDGVFSVVFNSSTIGAAKPEPAIYAHVLEVLGLPAAAVGFVDDSAENVQAARDAGMQAVRFTGVAALEAWLSERPVGPLGGLFGREL